MNPFCMPRFLDFAWGVGVWDYGLNAGGGGGGVF